MNNEFLMDQDSLRHNAVRQGLWMAIKRSRRVFSWESLRYKVLKGLGLIKQVG